MIFKRRYVRRKIREAKEGNLTELHLRYNKLTEIPDSITQLQNLTTLDLSGNNLTEIPDSITQLQNLTTLVLSGNNLTEIPDSITQLQNLTTLVLSGNQLTEIPDSITQLQNLTSLVLSGNNLTEIPDSITQLQNLTSLRLNDNQLTEIPDSITQLQNLTTLDLYNNQLTEIPDSITQLQSLTWLDLSSNNLTEIPDSITQLQNLTTLYLSGNPIEKPPLEVALKGVEAIRNYYRQLEAEGEDHLYEAKLLIVGEAGAGKTTLARKIENPDYDLNEEEKSTEGIDVVRWSFPMQNGEPFVVNIWDFGGQEIYHATHQFFLTKRSLYALVADTRSEDTDFYYWLNVVELLSDNSPLLIVKNEKQDRHREISDRQLRGRFDNLKGTLATNLADNRGLPEVVNEIKHHIQTLPHINSPVPSTWPKVRETLEKLKEEGRNYIGLDEYLGICEENGITQAEYRLQLSNYLHDLGICLHFQDDPLLNKTVILKPEWGTDAVYKVLDSKKVIRNMGRFSKADLADIWSEARYANMNDELLQLMLKFGLCYRILGSDEYIAPQLLTENQPKYDWGDADNLFLRYTYEFMPKGIVTRFIVAMHRYITDQRCVWKNGVVLEKDRTKAEIMEHYDRREIRIRIAGRYKRDLMTEIIHELDEIHDSFNRLRYDKLIPCNCEKCKDSQEPYFYPFDELRDFMADGADIQCRKSRTMVDPRGMIDDVIDREQFSEKEKERGGGIVLEKPVFEKPVKFVIEQTEKTESEDKKEEKNKDKVVVRSAWANGSFYLFAAVVVMAGVSIMAKLLPLYVLPVVFLSGILIVLITGMFQLLQDKSLPDKSFTELMKMVIKQLPLIRKFVKPDEKN